MRNAGLAGLVVLVAACALAGYPAGSLLARTHDTVRLADRVREENNRRLSERTLESEAFRATGRPIARLYEEAERIERRMKVGGVLLGLWIGLVLALRLTGLWRVPCRNKYTIDRSWCVSCGRCFLSCPRERARLK